MRGAGFGAVRRRPCAITRRSEGGTDPLGFDGSGVRGGGTGMPNPILEVSNKMVPGGAVIVTFP